MLRSLPEGELIDEEYELAFADSVPYSDNRGVRTRSIAGELRTSRSSNPACLRA